MGEPDRYAETPRLMAWREALEMALARLSSDEKTEFAASVSDRAHFLATSETVGAMYDEEFRDAFAGEYEFVALFISHVADMAERDSHGPMVRYCIKCREGVELDVPFCFTCGTDRWLIITRV